MENEQPLNLDCRVKKPSTLVPEAMLKELGTLIGRFLAEREMESSKEKPPEALLHQGPRRGRSINTDN